MDGGKTILEIPLSRLGAIHFLVGMDAKIENCRAFHLETKITHWCSQAQKTEVKSPKKWMSCPFWVDEFQKDPLSFSGRTH